MNRTYPLPATDDPELWPSGTAVTTTDPGVPDGAAQLFDMGSAIFDEGLQITWGDTPRYWHTIDEPSSRRGTVWHLREVCWLAGQATVRAPCAGLYAAFFRIRVQNAMFRDNPNFRAEWKADTCGGVAFFSQGRENEDEGIVGARQISDKTVSWSHLQRSEELRQGGQGDRWFLLHVGNVFVRGECNAELDVTLSFGGGNPSWCHDLDVDFAAIAPLRLSWDIERVIMIGHKKGNANNGNNTVESNWSAQPEGGFVGSSADVSPLASPQVQPNDGGDPAVSPAQCPFFSVPQGIMEAILAFAQPRLVSPENTAGDDHEGGEKNGPWRVF